MFINPNGKITTKQGRGDLLNQLGGKQNLIITDYLDNGLTLQQIIDSANLTDAWTSENLNISGTTTTMINYVGATNLINPAASNQPLLVPNEINGKPILRFITDDILRGTIANWRSADTSGQITIVVKQNSTALSTFFGSSDTSSTKIWDVRKTATTNIVEHLHNSGNTVSATTKGTQDLGTSLFKVLTIASNGSTDKMFVNGASETISSGTLGGKWLADLPTQRDNISLGGIIFSSSAYANVDIFGAFYGNYTSDADIIAFHDKLKTYLGL